MPSTARRLLVATPTLLDPNFFRAVVFMIEHTPDAALGVVLNRPSEASLDDALPEWQHLAAPPAVAFVGGPVQAHEAVIGIGRASAVGPGGDGWEPLVDRIGTVDLARAPADVTPGMEAIRVFAGYAAWGPGQLDGELALDGWYVLDADPADLLTEDPDDLWRCVLRRQGGDMAMVANFPLDPRTN
jgi:putative transcriptional regulator